MRKIYFRSLNTDQVTLLQPIPVCFTQDQHGFLIWCEGSNVNASGETFTEACDMLKSIIVDFYFLLKEHPEDKLGKSMKVQKRFLMEYVSG